MKYIGLCLVNFLDHNNMLDFHLSSLDGNTIPKKNPQMCVLNFFLLRKFKQNNTIFSNSIKIKKKNIGIFQKNVLNGRFVLFEVVKNHQS